MSRSDLESKIGDSQIRALTLEAPELLELRGESNGQRARSRAERRDKNSGYKRILARKARRAADVVRPYLDRLRKINRGWDKIAAKKVSLNQVKDVLARSGCEGVHEWFRIQMAAFPNLEEVWAEHAYQSLRTDYPTEAIGYGDRLIELGTTQRLMAVQSNLHERLGNLRRARRVAEEIPRQLSQDDLTALRQGLTSFTAMDRLAELDGQIRLLENGFQLPPCRSPPEFCGDQGSALYVLHNAVPFSVSGYAIRSHGLLKAIRSLGYNIHAATRLGYPWEEQNFPHNKKISVEQLIDGVPYIRLPSVINGYRSCPLDEYIGHYSDRLTDLARIIKPSVIHAASNFINGCAANLAARKLGLPSIYEVRGLWEITMASRMPYKRNSEYFEMFVRMETESARGASSVFAITEAVKAELVRRGVPEDKIDILPNGVDTNQYSPLPRDARLEVRFGLKDKTVIGYVGSLNSYEGLDLLLYAAQRIHTKSRKKVALLIVGGGPILQDLKLLARDLGLGDTVFTGEVSQSEVPSLYSLIDITPFPRRGLEVCELVSPLKPFEAMAMGKAIVCSNVAALAEIVSDNETGLLHAKDNVNDLADCLQRLLDSPQLRSRLGENARSWVCHNRDWRILAPRVIEKYELLKESMRSRDC